LVIGYIIVGLVLLLFGDGLAAVGGAATGFGVLLILVAIIIHTLHNSSPQVVATEYFITNLRTYVKYGLVGRRVIEVQNE
jgi:hypothetical protein